MRDSYSNHSFMCAIIPSSVVLLMHVFLDFLDFLVKSVRDSQSTKQAEFDRFFRLFLSVSADNNTILDFFGAETFFAIVDLNSFNVTGEK